MKMFVSPRLSLAALATASSLIALSGSAHAQSVCTATAGTIDCLPTVATVTYTTLGATVGGQLQGLRILSTADQTVTGSGTIATDNANTAVLLTSTGDLALAAGANGPLSAVATGTGDAFSLTAGDTLSGTVGSATSANGIALFGQATNDATLTTGALSAGGALVGGLASTNGNAALTVNGNVAATGTNTFGVLAFAPAGTATLRVNGNITNTGTGANAAGAAAVGVNSNLIVGNVTVAGGAAPGAALSSIATGGTASLTCGNVSSSADGVAGVLAAGTDVVIRCGNVTTTGTAAPAVTAAALNTIDAQVGNLRTTGDLSLGLDLTAPGAITASAGNIATDGAGATAVLVNGGAGPVTLATGNIATTGAGALGVSVTSDGAIRLNNTGQNVITTGAASHGVVLTTTTGPIIANLGRVSATGAGSLGVSTTAATGSQTLTVAGVAADLNGITATTAGTGAITINATAPVVSANGTGILATGTSGPIVITETGVTGALGGVRVTATGASPVTVNANAGTTTATAGDAIAVATLGTAAVNVGAGATVNGRAGFDAIDVTATGGSTITNRGNLSIATGSAGYAVRAAGGAATINNLAGATLEGPVLLTAFNDTVNNAGTLSLTGTSNFGAGADVLNNQAGGTLRLDRTATVLGLETLNNAGLTVAGGTTTLTGTTFNNQAGGTLTTNAGGATLAGLTAFNNAGTIDLSNGSTSDLLTLSGNYTGTGGARLVVDAAPGLGAADRLVIGGNAGGATQVDVNFVGNGPLYNPTGVLIVDAGGTGAAGAFALNPAQVQQGLLNYGIRQTGNDYFLASTLDASVGELGLVSSAGPEMWYQSFDAYHDSIMGRQGNSTEEGKVGMWANLYLSRDKYGDQTVTTSPFGQAITYTQRLENHRRGAQGGLEYRGGMFTVGVTGGYEHNRAEFGAASRMDIEGYNYGAYALFGMQNGIYGGVMYKRDEYDVDFLNNARAFGFQNDAHSDGVDGELGLRFGSGIKFDLNGGLSYVKTKIDPYANYGLTFDFADLTSLRGRLGGRVVMEDMWGLFLGAKVFHEFRDNARVDVRNGALVGSFDAPERGTWVRLEGGVGANGGSAPQFTLWADLGDTKGVGGRLGFHF